MWYFMGAHSMVDKLGHLRHSQEAPCISAQALMCGVHVSYLCFCELPFSVGITVFSLIPPN